MVFVVHVGRRTQDGSGPPFRKGRRAGDGRVRSRRSVVLGTDGCVGVALVVPPGAVGRAWSCDRCGDDHMTTDPGEPAGAAAWLGNGRSPSQRTSAAARARYLTGGAMPEASPTGKLAKRVRARPSTVKGRAARRGPWAVLAETQPLGEPAGPGL
ncbi:Phenylacetate--CoA ligase [Actinomadura verrucosospora]|uniref:Phenylacetate--CoA ligase n=1 Tax=Actinomadura verrucosospora TaxID=46165 RepID=A0A7D4AA43_ACTVE|nr:Phenylacetate--CoA ligase [Actinomadura verrucosospora]